MRDGVKLAANLFRPSNVGRQPTILLRTPYGKGDEITPQLQTFVDHGYTVVFQDVRGRKESEGTYTPLTQEAPDGDDTLNWIAAPALVGRQSGHDRRVLPRHRAVESGRSATIPI